jgi:hypothetical protein
MLATGDLSHLQASLDMNIDALRSSLTGTIPDRRG